MITAAGARHIAARQETKKEGWLNATLETIEKQIMDAAKERTSFVEWTCMEADRAQLPNLVAALVALGYDVKVPSHFSPATKITIRW